METIAYQLTTCSGLIVSPRSALAFYRDLDEFSLEKVEDSEYLAKSRLKVIYPFTSMGYTLLTILKVRRIICRVLR